MDLQQKLTNLAADLRENRAGLLNEWLGTLRIGMEKPGAVLTDSQLRNHFADLLEDLCDQLEVPLTEASEISALKHAEAHGDTRWAQGYKLPELIREIAALRTVIIRAVVAHEYSNFSMHERSLANIIVHRFFDALVVESATLFASLCEDTILRQERQRVARELHDSACQTLFGATLELAAVARRLDPATATQLKSITATLSQSVEDIRATARGLADDVRRFEHGLPGALHEFGAELSRVIPCQVSCEPGLEMPSRQRSHLFRIAQEAAGNACKHARPKAIAITLTGSGDAFTLRIRDDGCGFDAAGPTASGIGLHNMQERARSIGAELRIESAPGAGTTVTCTLPKSAVEPVAG